MALDLLPYLIASGAAGTGATTLVMTGGDGGGWPALPGDTIVAGGGSGGALPTGFTDSRSNTYTARGGTATTPASQIFTAVNGANPLKATCAGFTPDTLTVTYAGTGQAKQWIVMGCQNLGALDISATPTTGTSASPSISSGAMAVAGELVVVLVLHQNAGGNINTPSGWHAIAKNVTSGSNSFASMFVKVAPTTSSVTFTGTITSAGWSCELVSYRPAAQNRKMGVGASIFSGAYPGLGLTNLQAHARFNDVVSRSCDSLKRYCAEHDSTGWASSSNDEEGIVGTWPPLLQVVSVKPRRAVGGGTSAALTGLAGSITYWKNSGLAPHIILGNEANINGKHGPFGDGSVKNWNLSCPYSTPADDGKQNYLDYFNYYGPTVVSSGLQCQFNPASSSSATALSFMPPRTQADGWPLLTGLSIDHYYSNYAGSGITLDALISAAGAMSPVCPWGLGEWGATSGTSRPITDDITGFVSWMDNVVIADYINGWSGQFLPLLYYANGTGNALDYTTDSRIIAAFDRVYDAMAPGGSGGADGVIAGTAARVAVAGGHGTPAANNVALVPPPLFPLPLLIELLINGTWADISAFVYVRDGISITGGATNEGDKPSPAHITMTLNNRDGRFSPGNVSGAYYPYLHRNTQLRVSVQNATSASGNVYSGYRFWGKVSDWPPQSDVSGNDVYVQIDAHGPLRQVTRGGGSGSALTRYYGTLTDSYAPVAYWPCEEDPDNSGTIGAGLDGGEPMTVLTGTPAWKAVKFDGSHPIPVINNSTWDGVTGSFGGSGDDVYLIPGTYQWVASTTTVDVSAIGAGGGGESGGALPFVAGAATGGAGGGGGQFARNSAVAVTVGNSYTVIVGDGGSGGAGGFNDDNAGHNGNQSSFAGDSVSVIGKAGHGAPAALGATGGTGGTGGTGATALHNGGAGGSSGTAGRGGSGGGSSGGTSVAGNAGSNASSSAGAAGGAAVTGGGKGGAGGKTGSGTPNVDPGFNGATPGGGGGGGGFNFADNYGRGGGNGAPGMVELVYTPPAAPPANVCRFVIHVPRHGGQNNGELIRFYTGGTIQQLRVLYGTGGKLKLQGWSTAPALLFDSGFGSFGADGKTLMVSVELTPSGANTAWKLTAIDADNDDTPVLITTLSGTQNAAVLGNVSECTVGPNADITKTAMAHISVQYALVPLLHVARHLAGHSQEMGIDRFIRLANEQALDNAVEFAEESDHWGFETGTQSWAATNGAVSQSSVSVSPANPFTSGFLPPITGLYWPTDGTNSLLVTCNGGGALTVFSPGGTAGENILAGDTVAVAMDIYTPAALTGTLKAGIQFFDAGGTALTEATGTAVAFGAGIIGSLTASGKAPDGAAYFSVHVDGTGTEPNARLIYIDNVRVHPHMGPQTRKEYREFLEEIKDLDQGLMKEAKDNFGLKYRTRIRLINQAPSVYLDWSQGDVSPPFVPVFDDHKIKNDVTVHRHRGSRVRVTLDHGGATSVEEIGRYRKRLKVIAHNDAQIAALAAHLLNLHTDIHERYPTITVNLTRAAVPGAHLAQLMSAVAAVEIGDYVQVLNLPAWEPSTVARQLVIGYTETLGADTGGGWAWTITWNCTPEDPWEIDVTSMRRW